MDKKAFTLIELIFVIVVFGIISMFGADLYTKIYSSYAHTRAVNQLEARTMNAVTIISARLEDRIKGTVIARKSADQTFVDIRAASPTHDIIEWIGQSAESKNVIGAKPGWSGFADIYNFADPIPRDFNFTSQGSNLNSVSAIIKNLRNNADDSFGVVFKERIAMDLVQDAYGYDLATFNNNYVGTATGAGEVIEVSYPVRAAADEPGISEQYYLAHSAYAIVPVNHADPYVTPNGAIIADSWNFDLQLSYNYAPWKSEAYNADDTKKSIMVRDVSLFRFRNDDGAIALKLCLRDAGRNFDPEKLDLIICKSQVVY